MLTIRHAGSLRLIFSYLHAKPGDAISSNVGQSLENSNSVELGINCGGQRIDRRDRSGCDRVRHQDASSGENDRPTRSWGSLREERRLASDSISGCRLYRRRLLSGGRLSRCGIQTFRRRPQTWVRGWADSLHDPTDRRITIQESLEPLYFSPGSFIRPGVIQGANIAYRRAALTTLTGSTHRLELGPSTAGMKRN